MATLTLKKPRTKPAAMSPVDRKQYKPPPVDMNDPDQRLRKMLYADGVLHNVPGKTGYWRGDGDT